MDSASYELLRSLAQTASAHQNYSHVTITGPDRQMFYWLVFQDSYGPFWSGLCKLVQDNPEGSFTIGEPPMDNMPQIVDLLFPFQNMDNGAGEPYDETLLQLLAYCYQQAMLETLQIKEDDLGLVCYVMETPESYYDPKEKVHYMRIRLQFHCRSNVSHQESVTRPAFIRKLRDLNVISTLTPQPSADWEQIIIKDNLRQPVIMYGSEIGFKQPKLKLVHIYGLIKRTPYDDFEEPLIENTDDLELESLFRPTEHSDCQRGFVSGNLFHSVNDPYYWLPLFLSVGFGQRITLAKQPKNPEVNQHKVVSISEGEGTLGLARALLPLIKGEKYVNKSTFNQIGSALHHITNGDEIGLGLWKDSTRRALESYSPGKGKVDACYASSSSSILEQRLGQCELNYQDFGRSQYTIKTIAWFAKEDDPASYAQWHKRWYTQAMDKAKMGLDADVAEALYRMYWLEYVCVPVGNGSSYRWYRYTNHRWIKIDTGLELRARIRTEFIRKFTDYRADIVFGLGTISDESMRASAEITVKKIDTLVNRLGKTTFKDTIMKEIREHFENREFLSLLDSNPNLTGIMNGVIEVVDDQAIVRNGRPEDYISLNTGVRFRSEYSETSPKVKEVLLWMNQTFRHPDLVMHFRKLIASTLRGRNAAKMFPIWSGELGNNSKSAWIKAFKSFLGPYCTVSSVASISVNEQSASAATPELARLKAVRVTFINEPDPQERLKGGKIKARTGGDSHYVRGLYSDGGEQEQTDTLILVCNLIPYIPAADKVTQKRTEIFPFTSQWLEQHEIPTSIEEQYKQGRFLMNPFFEETVPQLATALLWLAVHDWPLYYRQGMNPKPESVIKANKSYWKDTDIYLQYIADCISMAMDHSGARDKKAKLTFLEVLESFEAWRKKWYPTAPAARNTVRSVLSGNEYLGPLNENNTWIGVRLTGGGALNRGRVNGSD